MPAPVRLPQRPNSCGNRLSTLVRMGRDSASRVRGEQTTAGTDRPVAQAGNPLLHLQSIAGNGPMATMGVGERKATTAALSMPTILLAGGRPLSTAKKARSPSAHSERPRSTTPER